MSGREGTMLYLDGVSVSFDGFKALDKLSIIVHPAEMLAIIGPNGAGKTDDDGHHHRQDASRRGRSDL